MRTGLTRLCTTCALRCGRASDACATCGRALVDAVGAARPKHGRAPHLDRRRVLAKKRATLATLVALIAASIALPVGLVVRTGLSSTGAGAALFFVVALYHGALPLLALAVGAALTVAIVVRWTFGLAFGRDSSAPLGVEKPPAPQPTKTPSASDRATRRLGLAGLATWALCLFPMFLELVRNETFGGVAIVSVGFLFVLALGVALSLLVHVPVLAIWEDLRQDPDVLAPHSPLPRASSPLRADLELERVPLVGRVEGAADGELLEAPLSGARCVAFGLHGAVGRDEVDDAAVVPFSVLLESGETVVVAATDVVFRAAGAPRGSVDAPAPPSRGGFFEARGLTRGRAQLDEWVLEIGAEVTVFADASDDDGAARPTGFQSSPRARAVTNAPGKPALVAMTAPSDGAP